MDSPLSRRRWLGISASLLALTAVEKSDAVESLGRVGKARMRLSLAAYSFRDFFKDGVKRSASAPAPEKTIDMFDFVDYCAEQGCDGAELTSYYFPANVDREYLLKLKRHAFLRGVAISGSAVGNTFTHPIGVEREKELGGVKKWIDYCAILGAPHLRVFAGAVQKGMAEEVAVSNCIETMKEACAYASEKGVFLGIENHGGIVAEPEPLLTIIKAVDSPWLGINLDTGNFHGVDPYAELAKCAPFAVNVQLKTEVTPKGQKAERADFKRAIQILREAKYQGFVALEFEEKTDPYKAVPGVLDEIREAIKSA